MESCNGYPTRLLSEGFVFQYPTIKEALADLISRR
jgi:NAD dependent epimerase/dehydratase family enzyme